MSRFFGPIFSFFTIQYLLCFAVSLILVLFSSSILFLGYCLVFVLCLRYNNLYSLFELLKCVCKYLVLIAFI